MYGIAHHELARQRIMDHLHAIFTSEKYEGKWTYETCPSGNNLDDEANFVRKVVIAYKQIILGETCDASDELTLEKRLAYIASKKDPASFTASHANVLVKYGTALEMEVFSLINKVNLWILQPGSQSDGGVSYKWHLSVIYNCPLDSDAPSNLIHQQYACFLCMKMQAKPLTVLIILPLYKKILKNRATFLIIRNTNFNCNLLSSNT